MPKSPAPKKTAGRKPMKPAVSLKSKKPSAPKPKKAAGQPMPPKHSGFMWKVLERKQAELKRLQEQGKAHPYAHAELNAPAPGSKPGFTRFNGPRRKAA